MAVIYKNPDLPDYFVKVPGVQADTPPGDIPSIVKPYENGRVLHFPTLKFDIDHDFWASLPSEGFSKLKKLSSSPSAQDPADDPLLDRRLADAGVPPDLERRLKAEIVRFYYQALPVYEALFKGYRFTRRQVVWRLNTIRNENLHIDTYQTDFDEHFARLFINLDDQPRIWTTSYGVEDLFEKFGGQIPPRILAKAPPGEVRAALNQAAFGGRSTVWWDRQPRHMVYFDPGDVWAVDSRQVSHQIFYGRRAVSIDFFVDPASMAKPKRHYLYMAQRLRAKTRAALQPAAAAAE